ncbi:MAG: glycoside hydrolase family 43 protein [Eubacterium sp.]|nr:glycoside hydrolase family 43 protein [Eubacterium sp.]
MSAYLFVHFTSEKTDKESIWLSVSRDGLHWQDLGGEEPFLSSHIGTKGVRDPFVLYDEKLQKYFIIATDLNTNDGRGWYDFSHNGSKSILVWESDDLVNWSKERLVDLGVDGAGCAWAPEAVYCRERGEWMVFFASCVDDKQRIYATFTSDFKTFSETFEYINNEKDIIDTSIVFSGGYYYRFSKDEVGKIITIQRAKELLSADFETLHCDALDSYYGVEGPEIFYIDGIGKWCLIVDRFHGNHGYIPLLADDLASADFRILNDDEYDFGKRKKRHGGVIKITDEEYDRLIAEVH